MSPSPSLLLVTLCAILSTTAFASLTVKTTNGSITGHSAANRTSVSEFLGIPFAQPPIGKLRFAPPQPYNHQGHQIASSYGLDCPDTPNPDVGFPLFTPQAQRVVNYFSANTGTPQGEDCLTLNVWTPISPEAGEAKRANRAVLIFFYGGRFTYGHTNSPFFDGEFLAHAQDVVVVTVNYRDNIFGFPGAPGIPQNPGLRDQRLAVEWLRDNIAAFGGDASLMTIFGQSAGAVAVDYWAYAYTQDPIVAGLISESGNALSFPLNTPSATLSNWYNVTKTLGCGSDADSLACVRSRNWTDVKAAAAKAPSASSGNPLRSVPAFYPVADNETVFEDYEALGRAGKFAKLPYLLGNNNFEQGYYALPDYRKNITVTIAEGDSFLLDSFTCPNQLQANIRASHGVPVWLYRYFGDWSNLELYPANSQFPNQVLGEGSGAYHGSELEMVFGNPSGVSGIPNCAQEQETIRLMQTAWADFAKHPSRGLKKNLKWPEYVQGKETLIRLAYNNLAEVDLVDPLIYFAACANYTVGS